MSNSKNRRITAIMFTDIIGYTALMQKDETTATTMRSRHRSVFQKYHDLYFGEIIQYYGDGTLSAFSSAVTAVQCAIAIQLDLQSEHPVPLRIGLHLGDIVFDGTEVYGDGVNISSRIESLGIAGSILLSGKLNDELKNQQQFTTKSLGYFELKNIAEPIEVFAVANDGIKVPISSELNNVTKKDSNSIAVLPFVNMSSDVENEYFSDGMTEEIINALAKIKGLKVTSRTSSFHFKNKNIPITSIGEALNVSTILEGSIRLSGNKMRITAQLIDVADDFHFWSETFDHSVDDIFAVQDEVSILIADKLREHVGHFNMDDKLIDAPNVSVEVYKKYLKGRYHLMKLSLPETEKAIEIFDEVINEAPDFPLPYLDVNQGYAYLGTMGMLPAQEAFVKAKPYLDKALELDQNLPKSQLNLAWICCWQNWDLEGAYRHLNKALDIRPSDEIYLTFSNTLTLEGKLKAALNYVDKALELDPFSAMNTHYKGFLFYLMEKFDKAIPLFEKALTLNPDLVFPPFYIGSIMVLEGKAKQGLTFFQNLPTLGKGNLTKLGGSTMAYIVLGDTNSAEKGLSELRAALQTDAMGNAMFFLILCHTLQGKHEDAIALIEKGIEYRLPRVLLFYTEPILKPLHANAHFQALMQQVLGNRTAFNKLQPKYKNALLDKKELDYYCTKLKQLMSEKELHLNPDLTLRNMAEHLEIPPNHLSQLLNEGFNMNFSNFVNSYRLKTFKSKVADSSQRHLTILALAYDSGFNSKTVFNTYFKKQIGITPRAYWKKAITN
ncbi:helix-turn-helix domain-containing protein [Aurantibacter crassamenti]|uniref:helix-turn-helix domain-containing protein n=1 Tax=Aurantibacter crassamenti TaxID=1837375 RepID=UPI00193A7CCD|nr:helix-turn-helix domain-containing protein [Aurantibacter crassamenti]MBM1105028.1 helix-turn-helix domain-containing protein [Aurantibacter crassamenti]